MSEVYLMNKNTKIALLDSLGDRVCIKRLYTDKLQMIISDINGWLKNRTSIIGRENILKLAELANIKDIDSFLKITKAISVTDTFWVDDSNGKMKWDEISPYSNRISKIIANIAIDGIYLYRNQNISLPSPQYRLDGVLDKCVRRVDNREGLYLYKTSGEMWHEVNACRTYSEYFVSQFLKYIGLNTKYWTDYNISEHIVENNIVKPYAYCKIFTNEKYGLMHYGDTIYSDYNILDFKKMIKDGEVNIKNRNISSSIIEAMMILDSIVLNPDRHKSNTGFIIDNDTFELIQVAPIYDNDCALGSLISIQDKTFEQAFNELKCRMPQGDLGDYDDIAKEFMTANWYNNLKTLNRINLQSNGLNGISKRRVDFMSYVINRRIQEILDLF